MLEFKQDAQVILTKMKNLKADFEQGSQQSEDYIAHIEQKAKAAVAFVAGLLHKLDGGEMSQA